jgi:hypothetical protein
MQAMEPVIDARDLVSDARGAVSAQRITVYPNQQHHGVKQPERQVADAMVAALRQQLQEEQLPRHHLSQQQQHDKPPWQQQQQRGLQTVPEGGMVSQQQQPLHATSTSNLTTHRVHVQHISSSGSPFDAAAGGNGSSSGSAQHAACLLEPGYCLQLMTVERRSQLWFHLQRAWVGAHMRTALAAAGAPGERVCAHGVIGRGLNTQRVDSTLNCLQA